MCPHFVCGSINRVMPIIAYVHWSNALQIDELQCVRLNEFNYGLSIIVKSNVFACTPSILYW